MIMPSRAQRSDLSTNNSRNNNLCIECEDFQLIRNSGSSFPTRHGYNTRYSARFSEISNNNSSTSTPSQLESTTTPSRLESTPTLYVDKRASSIDLSNCQIDPYNCWQTDNNSFKSDSTLLDGYITNGCCGRGIMSIRHSRHGNHLDPCSDPEIHGTSKITKVLIFIATLGVAAVFARFLADKANGSDMDGSIKKELHNIKAEINEMKSNVEFVLQKKEESAKKMANVESLLEEIKKTTQEEPKLEFGKGSGDPVENAIKDAINTYTADKTGKADFALESAGGSIVHTRNTENLMKGASVTLFGWTVCSGNVGARAMIQPGTLPGECWAFKGSSGNAVIKLLSKIYINGVTIEHIAKSISPTSDISTAPKEFSIWGLASADDETGDFLGKFIYNCDGPPIQFFPVEKCVKQTHFVEVKFHSNHGNSEYTCVYRIRVHGSLTDGVK